MVGAAQAPPCRKFAYACGFPVLRRYGGQPSKFSFGTVAPLSFGAAGFAIWVVNRLGSKLALFDPGQPQDADQEQAGQAGAHD
ncbi:hypothetical protein [Kineosporia babensis]|uniref:Uncharacterized protein n=1 Tax=Kineosporia babensis TaxID=499548 RepID=A0A9X1SYH4_9ACTN|nr:hypothetical protein [Kineosporia babensis]MCD5316929.1 hypothetical protein [Kineosporia babensis]